MDEAAYAFLWKSMKIDESSDESELPPIGSSEAEDFLWDALLEESREDGNVLSFFIVTAKDGISPKPVYVSPDWPSAEQFAQSLQ